MNRDPDGRMGMKGLSLVILITLIATAFMISPGSIDAGSNTHPCTRSTFAVGSGQTYLTITSAIAVASSGDTINVLAGSYHENVLVPASKQLFLYGAGSKSTVVDGGGIGSVVTIDANACVLDGFSITGSGADVGDAGLCLNSDRNTIEHNNISRNRVGILLNSSDGNIIRENVLDSNYGVLNVDEGLVGHWRMDEARWEGDMDEVIDASGKDNHGTSSGALTTYPGRRGKAGLFDGVDDSVQCNDDVTLDLSKWTISAWVNFEDPTGKDASLVDRRRDGFDDDHGNYAIWTDVTGGWLYHGFGTGSVTSNTARIPLSDITANEWYLIVGRYDGSKLELELYGNATHVHSSATETRTPYITGTQSLSFGVKAAAVDQDHFRGRMDEVRIYDRVLENSELMACYSFGEGAGLRIWNSSGNSICNNSVMNSTGSGVQLWLSHGNTLENNSIMSNVVNGISFCDSNMNTISSNRFMDNRALHVPSDGLIGYWKMDEFVWTGAFGEVKDSSSRGNNGTVKNGAHLTSNSVLARGGRFDGYNDYIEIENEDQYDLLEEFSISGWINKDQVSFSTGKTIISKAYGSGNSKTAYTVTIYHTGTLKAFYADGSSNLVVETPSPLPAKKWIFFNYVVANDQITLYVDGNVEDSIVRTFDTIGNTAPVRIGWNPNYATGYCFDGLIDEISIHDRVLSPPEIMEMYRSGFPGAVDLRSSDGNEIGNNTIDSNDGSGIYALESDSNRMSANTIIDNGAGAIYLDHSDSSTISNNSFRSNDLEPGSLSSCLEGHWKMDESSWQGVAGEVKDSSGNSNNGRAMMGAVTSSGRFGGSGWFDGINDYVNCGSASCLDIQGPLGISAWINATVNWDPTSGECHSIVSRGSFFSGGYGLLVHENDVDLRTSLMFWIRDGSGVAFCQYNVSNDWAVGEWRFVSGVYDGSSMQLYLDGVECFRSPTTISPGHTSDDLHIGAPTLGHDPSDIEFGGKIDEVRVYSRSLSDPEIHHLYYDGALSTIQLHGSVHSLIHDNVLSNHGSYAVRMDAGSDDNTVVSNVFINNHPGYSQASDDGASNVWSGVDGGNMYSDWTGPDTDASPGIVDLPYSLEGQAGARDMKPLCLSLQPPGNRTPVMGMVYNERCTTINAYLPDDLNFVTNANWLNTYPDGSLIGTPPLDCYSMYWVNASLSDALTNVYLNFTLILANTTVEVTNITLSMDQVYRNNTITVRVELLDHLGMFSQSALQPSLQCKHQYSTGWSDSEVMSRSFNVALDQWEFGLLFSVTSEIGSYSFRANCSDPIGDRSEWYYSTNALQVYNNIPSVPGIVLLNATPRTQEAISCAIIDVSQDVETSTHLLSYNYRWYINGMKVRDVHHSGIRDTLSQGLAIKEDRVECHVRSFDGIDHSMEVFTATTIVNTPPSPLSGAIYLTYFEDLYANPIDLDNYFTDVDGDLLNYSCTCSSNFTVDFDPFGMIRFTPVLNFNGNESALVSASDGEASCSIPVWLNFLPVNDAPVLDHIQNIRMSQGDEAKITIHGSDVFDGGSVHYGCDIFHAIHGITVTDLSFGNITGELWINATNMMVGEWNLTAWVEDEGGLRDYGNFNVTILNINDPPDSVEIFSPEDLAVFSTNDTILFEAVCTDMDIQYGQEITYIWRSNITGTIGINRTFSLQYLPPGQHTITVEAFDGEFTVSDSIRIVVTGDASPTHDGSTHGDGTPSAYSKFSGWIIVMVAFLLVLVVLLISIFVIVRMIIKKEKGEDVVPGHDVLQPEISQEDIFKRSAGATVSRSHRTIDIDVDNDTSVSRSEKYNVAPPHPPADAAPPEPPHAVGDPDRMIGTPVSLPPSSGTVIGDVSEDTIISDEPPMSVDVLEENGDGAMPDTPFEENGDGAMPDTPFEDNGDGAMPDTPFENSWGGPMVEPPSESSPVEAMHEGPSSIWTRDMAQGRSIAEKKLAMEQLKELASLHKEGVLSDGEFKQKKKELLRKI